MLCEVCFRMLRRQEGRIWKGTYDLHFKHHPSGEALKKSASVDCGICRVLLEGLASTLGEEVDISTVPIIVTALLSVPSPRVDHLYCLDFKIESDTFRFRRSFILRETENLGDLPYRTPLSVHTSSDEVYQLAEHWLKRCHCFEKYSDRSWYPTRLISLEELKKQNHIDPMRLESINDEIEDIEVRLVETSHWKNGSPPHKDDRYVTLSHCWGKVLPEEDQPSRLNSNNIASFKRGIRIRDLPRTFRHAIHFAARLQNVGFIWIDSLCIKQGKEEEADWLEQSSTMDKIYRNSYLNISATFAASSREGLYAYDRKPQLLLEDETVLNISGLPGAYFAPDQPGLARSLERSVSDLSQRFSSSELFESGPETRSVLKRCTVLNMKFWADRIDEAPVNRRGWVLQERLMAPRVLHFCRDQVAWECPEFEAAEGYPVGIPNFQLTSDGIRSGSRLKILEKDAGKSLREKRLHDYDDPDPDLPGINALELWSRIVEVYSKTAITDPKDKLIALSGLARWMSQHIHTELGLESGDSGPVETQYIAGLWRLHLASQLLWYSEPVFKNIDNTFHNYNEFPNKYRAPSFSWASIDTNQGNGIKYAEVTDKDLFIKIESVSVIPQEQSDEFGLLKWAHLVVWGKLRRCVLSGKPKGRFGWHLVEREHLDNEEHTIVYLDCPKRDIETILGHDKDIYVMPAAKGERTAPEQSKYLTCLILKHEKKIGEGIFSRIGLTKLSPYGDHRALDDFAILKKLSSDQTMPNRDYDSTTGNHKIILV